MTQSQSDRVPPPAFGPKTPKEKLEDARTTIAYIVIGAYVFLVIVNVALPVIMYLMNRPTEPFSMTDLKDLSSSITGILAGLVGILGFVVGYYFKSIDDQRAAKRASKARGMGAAP